MNSNSATCFHIISKVFTCYNNILGIIRLTWGFFILPDFFMFNVKRFWAYWWKLFQKRVMRIECDIYVFSTLFITI